MKYFPPYLLIVVSAVAGAADDAGPLLGVGADEVDLGVVEDLVVLVRRELVHVELHDLVRGGHHRLGLQQRGVGAWPRESQSQAGGAGHGAGAVTDREEFCYRELGLCIAQDRSTFETFEKRYNQDIHNWEIKPACVLCGATHGWCFVRLRHT